MAEAIKSLLAMPAAGAPRLVKNPQLAGLRTWPLKGFDEFRIYYLAGPDQVIILRVLHDKRDLNPILRRQTVERPGPA